MDKQLHMEVVRVHVREDVVDIPGACREKGDYHQAAVVVVHLAVARLHQEEQLLVEAARRRLDTSSW